AELSKLYIPHGRWVAVKIEPLQVWAVSQQKLFEALALACQLFVVELRHHHHGVAPAQNHLGLPRKSTVYYFAEPVLSIRQPPCHKDLLNLANLATFSHARCRCARRLPGNVRAGADLCDLAKGTSLEM